MPLYFQSLIQINRNSGSFIFFGEGKIEFYFH